jgi:hypothetical protein
LSHLTSEDVWREMHSTGHQTTPFEVQDSLHPEILKVWSESPEHDETLVGGLGLQYLRDANKLGATIESVVRARNRFSQHFHKPPRIIPEASLLGLRSYDVSPTDRPIPDVISVTTRSAKFNALVKIILASASEDKFVLFATGYDMEMLQEPLVHAEILL